MLKLRNGHQFSIACAAGALAFGRGYWWERHGLIPLGIINPYLFTIITKTITVKPKKGNLRWYAPWRAVRPNFFTGNCVNAVGLTNPGIEWLHTEYKAGRFPVPGLQTIVSIIAEDKYEAGILGCYLNGMHNIKGIELNFSCPNIPHITMTTKEKIKHLADIFFAVKKETSHPVGIKLGYHDPYEEICGYFDEVADWFNLINSVKWSELFPNKPSPLTKYNLEGGCSGPGIATLAGCALASLNAHVPTHLGDKQIIKTVTPIISGGGLGFDTDAPYGRYGYAHHAIVRLMRGASAVTLGTAFLTRPWRVNQIARTVIEWERNRKEVVQLDKSAFEGIKEVSLEFEQGKEKK